MSGPAATISVVLYRNPGVEARCLDFLRRSTPPDSYVLDLRDNSLLSAPLAHVWNAVANRTRTPYLVLLNSDAFVTPGWLDLLIDPMERDATIAATGPSTNRCGSPQSRVLVALDEIGMGDETNWSDELIVHVGLMVSGLDLLPRSSELSGFCLVLRMAAVRQVGYFDPAFTSFYGQETELLFRLRWNGWTTMHVPRAYVHHLGGATRRKAEQLWGFDLQADKQEAVRLLQAAKERLVYGRRGLGED